jgi:hypothetical protein
MRPSRIACRTSTATLGLHLPLSGRDAFDGARTELSLAQGATQDNQIKDDLARRQPGELAGRGLPIAGDSAARVRVSPRLMAATSALSSTGFSISLPRQPCAGDAIARPHGRR